jgi:hypothetical protein
MKGQSKSMPARIAVAAALEPVEEAMEEASMRGAEINIPEAQYA